MQLDENTIIGDLLDRDPGLAAVLSSMGLACMDCPSARGETVGEACEIHGIDAQELLRQLAQKLSGN